MLVGFLQFRPVRKNVNENLEKIEYLLQGIQADLIVLPELSNSGYLYSEPGELAPFGEVNDGSGPFLSTIQSLADQIGGVIVSGFAEKSKEGLYNSAAAVGGGGVIAVYRKIHLFANEKKLFLPGNKGLRIFNHKGTPIGMMVCFDWIFPEVSRTLGLNGARIIAHPSNLILPFCQQAMTTRSLENGVFSITTNRYGEEHLGSQSLTFTGCS